MTRALCSQNHFRTPKGDRLGGPNARPPRQTRVMVLRLLLVCLSNLVLTSGCTSLETTVGCTPGGGAFSCRGPDLANTRIELVNQRTLRQANTLWISAKADANGNPIDQLSIRWDSYILHTNQNGTACDQDMCMSTTKCGLVFAVSPPGAATPTVQACEGLMQCNSPTSVPVASVGFNSGCPSSSFPPLFTATTTATYQVLSPPIASQKSILTEKKIFVVSAPQLATYQTNLYTEAQNPSYVWYATWQPQNGTIPANDATRVDNYSANLKITRVRVLRGIPKSDPVTGMVALDNLTPLRPSSIVLVPNFDPKVSSILRQNRIRCYADNDPTGHPDGNINLTNCFTGLNNTGTPPNGATPTYLKAQPTDTLNWFAEFNPNESQTAPATPPTLGSNEVVVIEFTIEQS